MEKRQLSWKKLASFIFLAKKTVWLVVHPFNDLSKKEQEERLMMCLASTQAATIYQLVRKFFRLVRSRQGTQFDSWLASVEGSAIPELQRFANGLERDKAAVQAGLTPFTGMSILSI